MQSISIQCPAKNPRVRFDRIASCKKIKRRHSQNKFGSFDVKEKNIYKLLQLPNQILDRLDLISTHDVMDDDGRCSDKHLILVTRSCFSNCI